MAVQPPTRSGGWFIDLFLPTGRRKRLSFFIIYIFTTALMILVSEFPFVPFFGPFWDGLLALATFLISWVHLVNALRRIRDIWYGSTSYCLSKWLFAFLVFFGPFCLFLAPSYEASGPK